MLKTSLSSLDSVNLHNPDRTLLWQNVCLCLRMRGLACAFHLNSCSSSSSSFYFACYIWILNPQINFSPSRGLSDWLIYLTKVTCSGCLVWTLMNGFSCASILLSHIISQSKLHSLCRSSVTSSSPSSSSNVEYLQIYTTITVSSLCKHVSMLTLASVSVDVSSSTKNVEEILSCTLASPCHHPLFFHGPLLSTSLRHYLHLKLGFLANKEDFLQIKESVVMLWWALLCAGHKMRCLYHVSWEFPEPRKGSQSRVEEVGSNLLHFHCPHAETVTRIFLSTRILYSLLPRLFLLSW